MKNNQKIRLEILKQIFIMLILLIIIIIPTVSYAKEDTKNQLKVLIIEINPWLESKQMKAAT